MKKIFCLLLAVIVLPITVKASKIESFTDEDFFKTAHVGWNLGNSLDPWVEWDGELHLEYETRWGNPMVTQELIDYVHDQGFNTIRIPVSWFCHSYKDDNGHYVIYEEWLNRVKEVVDYAYNRGMYVMLNSHHDDEIFKVGIDDTDEYENIKTTARAFWTQIADKFKDYDEHLMFEAYNEINNIKDSWSFGTLAANQVNELNQIFVDAIRSTGSNNRYRLLVISPLTMFSTTEAIEAVEVPRDVVEHRIILSVHMYSALEDELLDYILDQISESAAKKGLRVLITEGGTASDFRPISQRSVAESNFVARTYEHGMIFYRWDNGSSEFMIFDRNDLSKSNTELISALVNPTKYTNPNGHVILNRYDQFYFKRLTNEGAFDEVNYPNWWGTWTNEELIPIPEGHNSVSMAVYNTTSTGTFCLHGIFFFDKDGKYITSTTQNFPGYYEGKYAVPSGAKYFRYFIYNAKENTPEEFFQDALSSKKFVFTYSTYKSDTLQGKRVIWLSDRKDEPSEDVTLDVNIVNLQTMNETEKSSLNLDDNKLNAILNKAKELAVGKGDVIGVYSIIAKEGSNIIHERAGGFTIKIPITNEMKKYKTLKLVYISEGNETADVVDVYKKGDYIEATLPHLSNYVLIGENASSSIINPNTGAFISISFIIVLLSILGITVVNTKNKKKLFKI